MEKNKIDAFLQYLRRQKKLIRKRNIAQSPPNLNQMARRILSPSIRKKKLMKKLDISLSVRKCEIASPKNRTFNNQTLKVRRVPELKIC